MSPDKAICKICGREAGDHMNDGHPFVLKREPDPTCPACGLFVQRPGFCDSWICEVTRDDMCRECGFDHEPGQCGDREADYHGSEDR